MKAMNAFVLKKLPDDPSKPTDVIEPYNESRQAANGSVDLHKGMKQSGGLKRPVKMLAREDARSSAKRMKPCIPHEFSVA